MKDPLVSVIIPAYNAASTIVRAINSVERQTFSNREIIVVNDGSTDNLDEVLLPYNIRMVSQSNSGAAAARNHGSRIARGDFLAFLDADDFWHPDKLRQQLCAVQQHPSAKYCITGGCTVSSYSSEIEQQWRAPSKLPKLEMIDFPSVFRDPYFGTPGVLMQKTHFESTGGFNENLATAEDVDLWLRAAYGGVVLKIPEILFYVVRMTNSLSVKFVDRTYLDNIHIINEFCKNHPDFLKIHNEAVNSAKAKVYENWGSEALIRGDLLLAKEKLILSLKEKPGFRSLYLLIKSYVQQR